MKRMQGIVLILIMLAALTPLYCFADEKTCNNGGDLLLSGNGGNDYTTYTLGDNCNNTTIADISISGKVSLDLNGKTLSANSVKCAVGASQCSLEITGTGTLTVTGSIDVNDDLTISGGTVTVTGSSTYGIYAGGSITISGGTVTVTGSGTFRIHAQNCITINGGTVTVTGSGTYSIDTQYGNIAISGGTVTATGGKYGIYAGTGSDITIRGGTVENATGSEYGIYANQNITIEKGGTVKEVSGGTYGIYTPKGTITISGTVTASGNEQAVYGPVKNAVSGIGWTDKAGTQGITSIQTTEQDQGQSLSFKKVRFPANTDNVTFKVVNGTWDDGTTGEKTGIVYSTDGTTWTLPEDQIPAVGSKPDAGFMAGSWDPELSADTEITENTTFTYTYKPIEDGMELPVEISVVQGNGEKGVPEDVKARTISLTIRLKQDGGLKLVSAPIELAVTPGGNREPKEITVSFMPDTPDFKETCGNYEYEVLVTPKEVKADIAGTGDDGPAYLLKAAAGSPDCEKIVVTLYWNNKAASEPEVIRVVALPEDEIGAYQLRADGTKEYLLFQTYDICMTYLGRDELCRGPERCYHK